MTKDNPALFFFLFSSISEWKFQVDFNFRFFMYILTVIVWDWDINSVKLSMHHWESKKFLSSKHHSRNVTSICFTDWYIFFLTKRCSAVRSSSKLANSHFAPLKYLNLTVFTFAFLQPNPDPSIPEPTIGKALLRNRGMFKEDNWYWICVGALLGFSVLFNICFIIALTFLNRKQSFTILICSSVTKNDFWGDIALKIKRGFRWF